MTTKWITNKRKNGENIHIPLDNGNRIREREIKTSNASTEQIEPKEQLIYENNALKVKVYSVTNRWKSKNSDYILEDLFPYEYKVITNNDEKIFKNTNEVQDYLTYLNEKNMKKER
jgi:hypothetical protein